jgi:TolA-binding protein
MKPVPLRFLASFWVALLGACSVDSARNHFILGEKLWEDRNYSAAVSEFDRVVMKDPRGQLGRKALYQAAMTQYLFLADFPGALQKLKTYAELTPDPEDRRRAVVLMGEITYAHLEHYEQAIGVYQALIRERPEDPAVPEFRYRVAKSQFYLFQFDEALAGFKSLIQAGKTAAPSVRSPWVERAALELGAVYLARGQRQGGVLDPKKWERSQPSGPGDFKAALAAYEVFLKDYPQSEWKVQAQFGVASCYEELNQLDEAQTAFAALKGLYPSERVIDLKLKRLRTRIAQRNR